MAISLSLGAMSFTRVTDIEIALRNVFQPGYHPQSCRLAAPRRTDKHDKLFIFNMKVKIIDSRFF